MSFDQLAPHYRTMEAVLAGRLLQQCRTRWLPDVSSARRALLVGEGHGRMLEACALALPSCAFTVVDRSAGMLEQARKRWRALKDAPPVTFQLADVRTEPMPPGPYDLIVTHFFFDCFAPDELCTVISHLSASAAPSAQWLVGDFTVPETGWRRRRALLVLALAYGFFRVATDISARRLTAPDEGLRRHGFQLQGRETFNHGLLQSDWWVRAEPGSSGKQKPP